MSHSFLEIYNAFRNGVNWAYFLANPDRILQLNHNWNDFDFALGPSTSTYSCTLQAWTGRRWLGAFSPPSREIVTSFSLIRRSSWCHVVKSIPFSNDYLPCTTAKWTVYFLWIEIPVLLLCLARFKNALRESIAVALFGRMQWNVDPICWRELTTVNRPANQLLSKWLNKTVACGHIDI